MRTIWFVSTVLFGALAASSSEAVTSRQGTPASASTQALAKDNALGVVAAPALGAAELPAEAGSTPPDRAAAARSSGVIGRLAALFGFLSMIAALLVHWSRDETCREDQSVFGEGR